MRVLISSTERSNFVKVEARTIFDFNVSGFNLLTLTSDEQKLTTETHLIGWFRIYTRALAAACKTGAVSMDDTVLLSGESLAIKAVRGRTVELNTWDIDRRARVTIHCSWKEALNLHRNILDYLRAEFTSAGSRLEDLEDSSEIMLPANCEEQ